MGLGCRILPTSTRNLRQTKAEMRRELEELRWNMRQGQPQDLHQPQATPPGSALDGHGAVLSPMDQGSGTFSSREATDVSASSSPHFEAQGAPGLDVQRTTIARRLDGFMVEAKKIDACFQLYVAAE